MERCRVYRNNHHRYVDCAWGCCSDDYDDPCCDSVFGEAPVIIGLMVGIALLIIGAAALIAICKRRSMRDVETQNLLDAEYVATLRGSRGDHPPGYYGTQQGTAPFVFQATPPDYESDAPKEHQPPTYDEATDNCPPPYESENDDRIEETATGIEINESTNNHQDDETTTCSNYNRINEPSSSSQNNEPSMNIRTNEIMSSHEIDDSQRSNQFDEDSSNNQNNESTISRTIDNPSCSSQINGESSSDEIDAPTNSNRNSESTRNGLINKSFVHDHSIDPRNHRRNSEYTRVSQDTVQENES